MRRSHKYFYFLLALYLGWSSLALAQTHSELQDPKLYTLVLWNDFLQKEGILAHVEYVTSEAIEILKRADQTQKQTVFKKLYDPSQPNSAKILISKTPDDHLTEESTYALSWTAFVEDNASFVIATRVAYLFALQRLDAQTKEPEVARQWVKTTFNIPPEPPSQTDYGKKLRGKQHLRLENFISTKEFNNHTLRFRILGNHDDALIVPVEKDPRSLILLEGHHENDPIEEVPLARLLNSIELQITGNLIKDIKFSENGNERTMMIGQYLASFLICSLFGQRLQLIKNGW